MTVERDQGAVGACWECGYSLRGLKSRRCPECGRGFDPDDQTTMNMGEDVGLMARFLMRPPGWPTHLLTTLAVLISLWAAAAPVPRGTFSYALFALVIQHEPDWLKLGEIVRDLGLPHARFLIGAGLWAVVCGMWIGRRVARGITVKRLSRQQAAPFAYWRRWLITPIVFGMTTLLCRSYVPARLGLWISKPWFEAAIKEERAKGNVAVQKAWSNRWLGIYPPSRLGKTELWVMPAADQAMIFVSPNGGFIYRFDDLPPVFAGGGVWWGFGDVAHADVRRVSERWYLVVFGPSVDE